MKKVIIGLLLICVVAGLVAVGTWAAFRDVETSTENLFTAGSMDLKVDGEDDPIKAYFDDIGCVKPGDGGEVEIELENVGCVDGMADIHIFITESDENEALEPELNVGDLPDDMGNMFDGELAAKMQMRITADLPPFTLPVIDGTVAAGEWDGATVIPVASAMGTVSVIAEAGYLYVLFDVLDSTDARTAYPGEVGNDQISININPTDGGSWGFPYDIIFETSALSAEDGGHHVLPWNPKVNSGTIDGWATRWFPNDAQEALPGDLESATVYSGGKRITEWKLPLATIAPSPGDTLKVGGAIDVGDGNSYVYPVGLLWADASTYVDVLYELLVAEGSVGQIACTNYVYGAMDAGTSIFLKIEWWVPPEVGNIIMTDTLKFDIEFSLDQAMEGCLSVVGIDQPEFAQECETVDISVDVRNTGGAPGECTVNVQITYPDGTVLAEAFGVPTGMIQPLQTVKVPIFDDLHIEVTDPSIPTPYTLTVTATSCCGDPKICEIEVTDPPCLTVVDIVQPTNAYWCDELIVEVGVHNEGGKPGECTVTAVAVDMGQNPIMAPVTVPVPVVAPCDTVFVAVNLGHIEEYWPGMIVVVAWACCDDPMDPYVCLPPIEVGPPPPVGNVGSTWTYDVVYGTASETTSQTYTMMGRGLTDPLPAANCVPVPSGEGPYYYMQLNTNPSCACTVGDPCSISDTPYRTMQGGTMGMVFLGMDIYGKESNSTMQMTFAPSCVVVPVAMGSTAEIAYSEYTAVSGSIGYPYAVGDSWTSRMQADAWMGAICGSAMGLVLPDTITTSTVVAVGVANPSGGYLDCVHITESAAPQTDDDGDGLYSEDPTVNGVDEDMDGLDGEDPIETAAPCVSDIYWSPTVKNMVERILPCSYDLPETWLLTAYTLAP